MARFFGYPSQQTDGYSIREVTPQTITTDITSGRLILPQTMYAGLAGQIEDRSITFLVAQEDSVRRGQIGINFNGPRNPDIRNAVGADAATLAFLNVPAPYRGRGIGTQLVHRAVAAAAQRERDSVVLSVETANTGARRLYERLGFEAVIESIDLPQFLMTPHDTQTDTLVVRPMAVMRKLTPPRQ